MGYDVAGYHDQWLPEENVEDYRRGLFKGGESEWQQEPFNEVLATEIMERIGTIDFVPYSLIWRNDMPY